MRSRAAVGSFCLLALGAACPAAAPPDGDEPFADENLAFRFEPIEVSGVTPRWGATVASGHVLGGVDDELEVSDEIVTLSLGDAALAGAITGALDVARFCACAFFDEGRQELVMIGGRNRQMRDEGSAVLVELDTGTTVALGDGGPVDHPIGCHAFFSSTVDRGYVYGGANGSGFTSDTWRWDPEARTFTLLDIEGPPGRYDAGLVPLADGGALLASGMGMSSFAIKFQKDVWRFDATAERWTELAAGADPAPPGRRYPWLALSPDEGTLILGYGSDSSRGESALDDLWQLDLSAGSWSEVDLEGERPSARGFTYRLPGPAGSAGVLAFGSDAELNVHEDAFTLVVPDALAGEWR